MITYIALGIFALSFIFIVLELYDKSLIALSGALLMVIFGILSPDEAVAAVDFETILLLMGMMLIVHIASSSGIFAWLNVRIASFTKGNPLAIFLLFSLCTAVFSAFLDNVTTILLIVPLTIELVRGMGKDPRPYVIAEIFFANIGGAISLIGDPSNIIIGGASGFNFVQFLQNMSIPIFFVILFTLGVFMLVNRKNFKPISDDLAELTIANVIIQKIKTKFIKRTIHKDFVYKALSILLLTLLGFVLQEFLGLPNYVIAFTGAILLGLLTSKRLSIHESLKSVEWPTLFFFSGLFIMVAGVEKTGILSAVSNTVAHSTSDIFLLSLIVLWSAGLISMALDNIPFVTIMVPVILGIQAEVVGADTSILWWALSMGACLGGNGTVIGGSANVVAIGMAKKHGVNISFLQYAKFSVPTTIGVLTVCSIYLFFRLN